MGIGPSRNRARRQFDHGERCRTLIRRSNVNTSLQAPANRCHSSDVITSASIPLTIHSDRMTCVLQVDENWKMHAHDLFTKFDDFSIDRTYPVFYYFWKWHGRFFFITGIGPASVFFQGFHIRGCRQELWVVPSCLPFLPFPFPLSLSPLSLPFPTSPISSPPICRPFPPLEVGPLNPARGSGETL